MVLDTIYKIAFIAINFIFFGLYLYNFIISLIRDIKAKNKFKNNQYLTVEGTVIKVEENKKYTYVVIEFIGPKSLISFTHTFQYLPDEYKKNPYQVGDKVNLAYNDISNVKKLHTFPIIIEGTKPKLEKGAIFANLMLVGVASYFSIKVLIDCLSNWSKNFVEIFNTTYVLIVLMIYLVLLTYLIESIFSIPKAENQDYLKTYGQHARARVVTFKLAGKKNQRGFKESRMTIEYRNHLGDLTKTTLSSYMYTETQEEYIDVIYDPKNPKNVVYLRK